MSFVNSSPTLALRAKLTPIGRERILSKGANIVTQFALGDPDANYNVPLSLNSGEIPDNGGALTLSTFNNSIAPNYTHKGRIIANNTGLLTKRVENVDALPSVEFVKVGNYTVTNTNLTSFKVDRLNFNTDRNVNYFTSFNLPFTQQDQNFFNNIPSANGGFSDTEFTNLNQDEYLIISIPQNFYSELIDGKTMKVDIGTLSGVITAYGTYQRTLSTLSRQDANFTETSQITSAFGRNIVALFSDSIQRPNNDITKSWATGFNTTRPFSLNNKELFNLVDNTNAGVVSDKPIGYALLDKGFIIISDPSIVSDVTISDPSYNSTSVRFDTYQTRVIKNYICVVGQNEFFTSTNPTYTTGDLVRVSEVLLLDSEGVIIAVGKLDRHLTKNKLLSTTLSLTIEI